MKKERRKLKLSKETLRGLTEGRLLDIKGGISGMNVPDSCGITNGYECPSDPILYACGGGTVSSIQVMCTCSGYC
jgi:hypothetical protein